MKIISWVEDGLAWIVIGLMSLALLHVPEEETVLELFSGKENRRPTRYSMAGIKKNPVLRMIVGVLLVVLLAVLFRELMMFDR